MTRDDFDLAEFRAGIARWVGDLNNGRGFVLLRGFHVAELTPEQTELAYVGLGMQLGLPVGQDAHASLLTHIRDEGLERTDRSVRLYRTRQRQDFHTDGSDIVGLLCLHQAKSGGQSGIASSYAVYNQILRQCPDLVEVLYAPMYWDRNDEQPDGEDPFFAMPVFNDVGGTPRVFFIGWYIRDAQRHPQAPRRTGEQLEALDIIEAIANDPEFYLAMEFEPGDIQLISNAKILHSREAYEDYDDPDRRRHLLWLWLTAHVHQPGHRAGPGHHAGLAHPRRPGLRRREPLCAPASPGPATRPHHAPAGHRGPTGTHLASLPRRVPPPWPGAGLRLG